MASSEDSRGIAKVYLDDGEEARYVRSSFGFECLF